ncbi:MAG: NADH-quinone oxidoreductase subunit N [Pirellulales bacterium]
MDLSQVIADLTKHTAHSVWMFQPEIWLCATIVAVLLVRLFGLHGWISPFATCVIGVLGANVAQASMIRQFSEGLAAAPYFGRIEFFDGLLVYDNVTVFFRLFLLAFALLLLVLMRITGVPDRDASSDVFPLILGATLGMCLMASANHLLIVFLGVEMASVPSYALAGMLKGRRRGSEAALKYAVFGAGAAGVMLYGISLVAGVLGTVHLPTMAQRLAEMPWTAGGGEVMALALGGLMVMVGLAFKLSAVPFHFWCPDVFEGATAEINAFLSVASKAAALALLVRVAVGVTHLPEAEAMPMQPAATSTAALSVTEASVTLAAEKATPEATMSVAADNLSPVRSFVSQLIALVAIITCTFGNLAAYAQTNIKRMFAYSTIAHAGYMMMPVAAAVALLGDAGQHATAVEAIGSLLVYAVMYLFMNLGAFAIVAFLRNKLLSEEIADYSGLIRSCPTMVVCFVIILLSLVGLPPLAGFAGKFVVFVSLAKSQAWLLLVVAGLNTGLSLFYYLRVVKVMCIDAEPESRSPVSFSVLSPAMWYALAVTTPVVLLGVLFSYVIDVAESAVRQLL